MTFGPIEARIIVLQRGGDLVHDAGARGSEEAFERQRLDAFHDHAAHHLDRGGGADFRPGDGRAHAERRELGRDRFGMRTGEQQRRLVARRMNRRDDGDIDVACGAVEEFHRLLLAVG